MSNKIICTICAEELICNDSITSTNCGHVYHDICIKDWFERSLTCPQCRSETPITQTLFLTFEKSTETKDGEKSTADLMEQLEDVVLDSSKMVQQLQESKLKEKELEQLLEINQTQLEELEVLKRKFNEAELNMKDILERLDEL